MGVTVNSKGLPSTSDLLILFTRATVSQLSSGVSADCPTWTVKAGLQWFLFRVWVPRHTISAQDPSGPTLRGRVLFGMWIAASLSLPVSMPTWTPIQLLGPAFRAEESRPIISGYAAGMDILPWVGFAYAIPFTPITVLKSSCRASPLGS